MVAHTLVEVGLVEVLRPRDVHVVQTGDLGGPDAVSARAAAATEQARGILTFRWPRKCWRSLISRRARLARIFLLKTLVTFLMATPSLVWLFTAALQ